MKATKIAMALAVIIAIGAMFMQRGGGADHILITDAAATPMMNRDVMITLKIENRGTPDRLIGATSPEAKTHFHQRDALNGAPLPADDVVELAGDAAHIVLSALEGEAAPGRLIPITLTFENAGEVALKAQVKNMGTPMSHSAGRPFSSGAPGPSVEISAASAGDGWSVTVLAKNFTFSKDAADGPHEEGVGHGHLYVGGMKIGRIYGDRATIGELPPGEHVVRVSLNTNDHRVYTVGGEPVTATTTIVVD